MPFGRPLHTEVVSSHLGGLVMGMVAVVLGAGLVVGAIRRRQMRHANAPTYAAMGGVVYTIFQFGCAGLLILVGLLIVVLVLLSGSI